MYRAATFLASLAVYHALDFILHNRCHPQLINLDTCLCSAEYVAALTLSLAEYTLEYLFCAWKRKQGPMLALYTVGLLGMVCGDGMRKLAMLQNKVGFTHKIAHTRRDDHKLVVSGIYRVVRHPGYLGWFIWAVSTQIMLANPVSVVIYTLAVWLFFRGRIPYEERLLLHIFGREYLSYMKRTRRYIPFIPELQVIEEDIDKYTEQTDTATSH